MPNIKISDLETIAPGFDPDLVFVELQTTVNGELVSRKATASELTAGASPLNADYVTVTPNAILPNERILAGTVNVLSVTDGGAGANITLDIEVAGIDNARLADMAQATVKGRADGAGTGVPVDLTATQLNDILASGGFDAYFHLSATGRVIGSDAGTSNTGDNVFLGGALAGDLNIADGVIAIGQNAFAAAVQLDFAGSIAIGRNAGAVMDDTRDPWIIIGDGAAANITGRSFHDGNTVIGTNAIGALAGTATLQGVTVIGHDAASDMTGASGLGVIGSSVVIGHDAARGTVDASVTSCVIIGRSACDDLRAGGVSGSVVIGNAAGQSLGGASLNVLIGSGNTQNAINIDNSIVIGCNTFALSGTTDQQIIIGHSNGTGMVTGEKNILLGSGIGITGPNNDFDGSVIIGQGAGSKMVDDQDIFAIEVVQSNTSNLARPFLFGNFLNGNLALLNIAAMTGGVETGDRIVPAWADAAPTAGQGVFSMYGAGTDLAATTDTDFVHLYVRSADNAMVLRFEDGSEAVLNAAADAFSLSTGGVEMMRLVEAVGAEQVRIALTPQNNAAAPSLAFGNGDTGFYESTDGTLNVSIQGVARWEWIFNIFQSNATDGPALVGETASATNPVLIPNKNDQDTGIGWAGADQLSLIASGVEGLRFTELSTGVVQAPSASVAVTAFAGGGQGSATPLIHSYNIITVVATAGDSVRLPDVFAVNSLVYIKNDDAAEAADVFPASGDDLGAGVDTAVSLAAGESLTFIATIADSTWTLLIVDTAGGAGVSGEFDNLLLSQTPGVHAASPTLRFGDGNTGFYENSDNQLAVSIGGVPELFFDSLGLRGVVSSSFAIANEAASSTNPTLIPNQQEFDTGIGWTSADRIAMIAGGSLVAEFLNTAGVEQIIVPQQNNAATPSLAFGDGDSGFYEEGDDTITVTLGGTAHWDFNFATFRGNSGVSMVDAAPTATAPNIRPGNADNNTGIGSNAADQLSLIAGGIEMLRLVETGVATTDQVRIGPAGIIGAAATPALAFGDGDTGMYEVVDDAVNFTNAGADKLQFGVNSLSCSVNADSFTLLYQSSGPTVPTFVPDKGDTNTGIGHGAVADQLSLVAGGLEMLRLAETGVSTTDQLIIGPAGVIGAVGTPSLAFGDGDTGLFESADDVLNIATLGVTAITINASQATSFGVGGLSTSGDLTMNGQNILSAFRIDASTDLELRVNTSENAIIARQNGGVEIYHDNGQVANTQSVAAAVNGVGFAVINSGGFIVPVRVNSFGVTEDTTTYTIDNIDGNQLLRINNTTNKTWTVDNVAGSNWAIGDVIRITRDTATGTFTLSPGSGVTIRWRDGGSSGTGSHSWTLRQYGLIRGEMFSSNVWYFWNVAD